jgi:hypothetical protein
MKWRLLVVLAALWTVACRERESGAEDAGARRAARSAETLRSGETDPPALWHSREEFLRFIEIGDEDLRPKIAEALQAEFVAFAVDFEDLDAAVVEFAALKIEGTEEGPERDGVLEHLLEVFPEWAYRGKLQVVLDYYS